MARAYLRWSGFGGAVMGIFVFVFVQRCEAWGGYMTPVKLGDIAAQLGLC